MKNARHQTTAASALDKAYFNAAKAITALRITLIDTPLWVIALAVGSVVLGHISGEVL